MTKQAGTFDRRDFLRIGSAAIVTAAAATAGRHATADTKPVMLDEKDAQAQALGYHSDTTKVDKAKYPKHAATQMCGNCAVYQGKAGAASGPCPIFGGKSVNAKGWCMTWTKKA
ncbi:MAG: high-potential iron-sulfur protein [Betaproteobacteria bacterium]